MIWASVMLLGREAVRSSVRNNPALCHVGWCCLQRKAGHEPQQAEECPEGWPNSQGQFRKGPVGDGVHTAVQPDPHGCGFPFE